MPLGHETAGRLTLPVDCYDVMSVSRIRRWHPDLWFALLNNRDDYALSRPRYQGAGCQITVFHRVVPRNREAHTVRYIVEIKDLAQLCEEVSPLSLKAHCTCSCPEYQCAEDQRRIRFACKHIMLACAALDLRLAQLVEHLVEGKSK